MICELSIIKKLCTGPYRPQMNGQCEQFNSTLISIIGMFPNEAKFYWQEDVSTLVHVYNCTHSNATWFSPYFLMYGRHPMLPIDIQFNVRTLDISATTTYNYVIKLHTRLEWSYRKAHEVNRKEIQCSKNIMIKMSSAPNSSQDTWNLSDKKAFKGKCKIHDRWEIHSIMF